MTSKQFIKATLLSAVILFIASVNNNANAQRRIIRDRMEDVRDRREDIRDRREDVRDRREDVRDRREDIRDRRHPRFRRF